MKLTYAIVAVPTLIAFTACTSSTVIQSRPQGARLFLDGAYVGTTPYTMTDTKIVGSATTVRLEYPGHEPVHAAISRNEEFDVGACIGGLFVWVPFLWIMKYKPEHTFELRPAGYPAMEPGYAPPPQAYPAPAPQPQPAPPSAAPAPAPAPAPVPVP